MPLEISEIGVRMAVGGPAAPAAGEDGQGRGGNGGCGCEDGGLTPSQMDAVVERCIREVLRALKAGQGR
ncbi:hypothetical protein M2352_003572 [Azospirillum fermentarium]|uniref:DUF5908 family protein n=1 Tax=Azospirillum fermentarium TaxID=1233114 RepID=UPI00222664D4|nr:DUF5908 family protein [Azospirillum fermentarium]MCW2247938.1 hypothetical protein [Azospirillum fermentarium]